MQQGNWHFDWLNYFCPFLSSALNFFFLLLFLCCINEQMFVHVFFLWLSSPCLQQLVRAWDGHKSLKRRLGEDFGWGRAHWGILPDQMDGPQSFVCHNYNNSSFSALAFWRLTIYLSINLKKKLRFSPFLCLAHFLGRRSYLVLPGLVIY